MQASSDFLQSYLKLEKYPSNLICQPMCAGSTVAYEQTISKEEPRLLLSQNEDSYIRFLELKSSPHFQKKRLFFKDKDLRDCLENKSTGDTSLSSGPSISEESPQCRFVFILAQSSRSELSITRKPLLRLLSYHQVMPDYIDFLTIFGRQEDAPDPLFVNFCELTMLGEPAEKLSIPQLKRSGRQFQLCYIFKAPAHKVAKEPSEWSIRPAAVNHQFDIEYGTTFWTITHGHEDIYIRIRNLTDKFGRPEDRDVSTPMASLRSSLAIHLLLALWSSEQWRPYVNHLESEVEERTGIAVYGERSQVPQRHDYKPDELRLIQLLEDRISIAIAVLEGNVHVATSLSKYYQHLLKNPKFSLKSACEQHIEDFTREMDGFARKMGIELARAKFFVKVIADRKGLILQYLQAQENEKIESVSLNMRLIALRSHREAIAVSIITVVTLIYLPGTFVSSFFSTDVVKYQNGDSDAASFSVTALSRWLQVTLPLTALTLFLAWKWFRMRDKSKERVDELPYFTIEKN